MSHGVATSPPRGAIEPGHGCRGPCSLLATRPVAIQIQLVGWSAAFLVGRAARGPLARWLRARVGAGGRRLEELLGGASLFAARLVGTIHGVHAAIAIPVAGAGARGAESRYFALRALLTSLDVMSTICTIRLYAIRVGPITPRVPTTVPSTSYGDETIESSSNGTTMLSPPM